MEGDLRDRPWVTRVVDLSDDEIRDWRDSYEMRANYFTDQEVVHSMLANDDEITANVFSDWRTNEALPSDFELQYTDVSEVEEVAPDGR